MSGVVVGRCISGLHTSEWTCTWKGWACGAPEAGGPTKSRHLTSSRDSEVRPIAFLGPAASRRGRFLAYSVGSDGIPGALSLSASLCVAAACTLLC